MLGRQLVDAELAHTVAAAPEASAASAASNCCLDGDLPGSFPLQSRAQQAKVAEAARLGSNGVCMHGAHSSEISHM
ncbi:hypothetical protein FOA52_014482 [Chlamydomonas sp. UWO 241]|nr:hypothetical protein FOA52_014482 [Chlamydomonas sp. UWO 241]